MHHLYQSGTSRNEACEYVSLYGVLYERDIPTLLLLDTCVQRVNRTKHGQTRVSPESEKRIE
jgi:hypothetical protein